jgi:hypothetical protein
VSADVFSGAQIAARVAVLADAWSLIHLLPQDAPEERGFTTHSLATLGARVWILPTLWLQAGVGVGFLTVVGPSEDVAIGPAAMVVIGRELRHQPRNGIDISARLGASRFEDEGQHDIFYTLSGVVGYHWN